MKEVVERDKITIVDKETGELFEAPVSRCMRYYSIKNINFKGTTMSFMEKQAYICKGPKDIMTFWWILHISKDNIFRNPIQIAKDTGFSYKLVVAPLIKRGIEAGMWKRVCRGVYLINPYVFLSKGISNKTAEKLQKEHYSWILDEKYSKWLEKMKGKKDAKKGV